MINYTIEVKIQGTKGTKRIAVKGYKVNNPYGLELFYHKDGKCFMMSEKITGMSIEGTYISYTKLRELKEAAFKKIELIGVERIKEMIKEATKL